MLRRNTIIYTALPELSAAQSQLTNSEGRSESRWYRDGDPALAGRRM